MSDQEFLDIFTAGQLLRAGPFLKACMAMRDGLRTLAGQTLQLTTCTHRSSIRGPQFSVFNIRLKQGQGTLIPVLSNCTER